jgi:hypothetical protein
MRYVLAIAILVSVIAWLVLSYLPGIQGMLPTIAFTGAWATLWLPVLAGLTLAVFVGIQLWLVFATGRMVRTPDQPELRDAVRQFGLRTGPEMILTAVPVAMTVVLGLVVLFVR